MILIFFSYFRDLFNFFYPPHFRKKMKITEDDDSCVWCIEYDHYRFGNTFENIDESTTGIFKSFKSAVECVETKILTRKPFSFQDWTFVCQGKFACQWHSYNNDYFTANDYFITINVMD